MPFDVQMPDGTIIQGVPDGTTKEQVHAKWKDRLNAQNSPVKDMGIGARMAAGAGRQLVGRARSVGNMLGMVSDEDYTAAQKMDKPLMDTTSAKVGGFLGDVALSLPMSRFGMTGAVAGGAALGLTDPDAKPEMMDRLKSAAIGGGAGAIGQKLGTWASKKIGDKLAAAALRKAKDLPKREAIEEGMKLGMVAPPSAVNPKLGNRLLESFAGKEAIEQEAQLHNGQVMQDAMRKFLGLSDDAPMTVETLKGIRQQAGQAYDDIKGLGGTFYSDSAFLQALQKAEGAAGTAGRSFPGLGNAENVRAALAPLKQLTFKPGDGVDAIKALREGARESFGSRQSSLGRAQLEAAKAMEDLIERNLQRQGVDGTAALKNFRDARVTVAKSYAVEKVINKATGNVQGAKLSKLLASDAPITGELKTIAKFASALPSVTREQTRSPGVNALTTLFGVEAAMLGHPAPMLLPPARYGMSKLLLSKSFQKARALPTYTSSNGTLRTMQGLGRVAAPAALTVEDEVNP